MRKLSTEYYLVGVLYIHTLGSSIRENSELGEDFIDDDTLIARVATDDKSKSYFIFVLIVACITYWFGNNKMRGRVAYYALRSNRKKLIEATSF